MRPEPVSGAPGRLVGGIAAFNEEASIGRAIRSLLTQRIPPEYEWDSIWVVASGCSDGTARVVTDLSRADRRIRLVEQPDRLGKSAALFEILRRAHGTYLILLNSDAEAEPGAVTELIRCAERTPLPFGIMAQPRPARSEPRVLGGTLALLWELHHEFHRTVIGSAEGSHLSDELILLPIGHAPPVVAGIVNDGAFLGTWLRRNGGQLRYAPDARVAIDVPKSFSEHLAQRRRIHWGHRQIARILGSQPSTLERFAFRHPGPALRMVAHSVRPRAHGLRDFAILVAAELLALALSTWDNLPPRRDHVLWKPIETVRVASGPTSAPVAGSVD